MFVLVIETATAACSVALLDGDRVVAARHELVGRGHAERLVPMIGEVLAEAGQNRADLIQVDCGPGSFTGLRVGISAARGWLQSLDDVGGVARRCAGKRLDDKGLLGQVPPLELAGLADGSAQASRRRAPCCLCGEETLGRRCRRTG